MHPSSEPPAVCVQHLSKSFNNQLVVDQLSFHAVKGKVLGFLGPNGAGKSTTMKLITGYLKPSHGKIFIKNYALNQYPRRAKQYIGYLPENNPLYLDMYVHEYLQFIGKIRGLSYKQALVRSKQLVDACGITVMEKKKLNKLSKGYRQRVGLAQVFNA